MLTWSYPSIKKDVQTTLIARSGLDQKILSESFRWSKYANQWQYLLAVPIENAKSPRVKAICVAVLAEAFNPEKYHKLLQVLVDMYRKALSPRPFMQAYLTVYRTGKVGSWSNSAFDSRRALIKGSPKELITKFGDDAVLFWMAVLLKKRVLVYSDSLSELLLLVRTFPIFAWHRQDWGILRPLVCLGPSELKELSNASVYVAGCTDERCSSKNDFFDLFVDASSGNVVVSPEAKASFRLSQYHKTAAELFVKAAANETDQGVIKVVAMKTKALIAEVQKVKAKLNVKSLKLSDLSNAGVPEDMARFLFDVAMAEGLAG